MNSITNYSKITGSFSSFKMIILYFRRQSTVGSNHWKSPSGLLQSLTIFWCWCCFKTIWNCLEFRFCDLPQWCSCRTQMSWLLDQWLRSHELSDTTVKCFILFWYQVRSIGISANFGWDVQVEGFHSSCLLCVRFQEL